MYCSIGALPDVAKQGDTYVDYHPFCQSLQSAPGISHGTCMHGTHHLGLKYSHVPAGKGKTEGAKLGYVLVLVSSQREPSLGMSWSL